MHNALVMIVFTGLWSYQRVVLTGTGEVCEILVSLHHRPSFVSLVPSQIITITGNVCLGGSMIDEYIR